MTERNLFSEIVEGFGALKNREWAGLTDEEVEELAKWADKHAAPWHLEFARAVETKLKEKNQVKGEEMTDLRQALAQEEKPPVKSYCGGKPNYCTPEVTPDVDAINISAERVDETAKREHEPVEYTGNGTAGREADVKPTGFFFQMPKPVGTKLYTAPPKREWVGITDEEIDDWFFQRLKQAGDGWALDDVVRAVEAKLKEKNT